MDVTDPTTQWLTGLFLMSVLGFFGFFWKLHQAHQKKLDEFKRDNSESHGEIHTKIEEVDDKSQDRHLRIRDKLDEIYHLIIKRE